MANTGSSSKNEGSSYPAYFYQHPENLVNPVKQDRVTPYIARAFHMTQPDDRIKASIFQQNVSYFDDSILSSNRHGLFASQAEDNGNNG